MKTAISLPDDLFVQADQFAREHGLSRSELYATALREYVDARSRNGLIERINQACESVDTSLPPDIAHRTRQQLLVVEW